MHWIVQRNIFRPANYEALTGALDALEISHTTVAIPAGTHQLVPDYQGNGRVYVCGAMKLAKIAHDRGWWPGSFLNDQFSFARWSEALGSELLNATHTVGTLSQIQVPTCGRFFIRPAEDNKAFDGAVIDADMLAHWRADVTKRHLLQLDVVVSPPRQIYREYRLFVVQREIVTGSVYKVGGKPYASSDVEADVLDYARVVIARWTPADSFVIDIALTPDGFKVIEFNNINSSGFYASDVFKYVNAIQTAYAAGPQCEHC